MTTTMTDLQTGRTFVFNDALPGRDAYEEALAMGFEGTRQEWIASLRGLDFDPSSPAWENDRTYPPRAAVIHLNSFWFARVTNQSVEPGSDDAVWMKLVHGEDAAALTQALTDMAELRDAAALLEGASEAAAISASTAQGAQSSAVLALNATVQEREAAEAAAQTALNQSTAALWFLSETAETQTFMANPTATLFVSETDTTITLEIIQ